MIEIRYDRWPQLEGVNHRTGDVILIEPLNQGKTVPLASQAGPGATNVQNSPSCGGPYEGCFQCAPDGLSSDSTFYKPVSLDEARDLWFDGMYVHCGCGDFYITLPASGVHQCRSCGRPATTSRIRSDRWTRMRFNRAGRTIQAQVRRAKIKAWFRRLRDRLLKGSWT